MRRRVVLPTLSLCFTFAAATALVGCDKSDPFDDLKEEGTGMGTKGGKDGGKDTKGGDDKTSEDGGKDTEDEKTGDGGGGGDTKTGDGGGGDTGTGDGGGDTGTGGGGSGKPKCAPKPERYILLGDETALGTTTGLSGPEDSRGGFRMMYEHLVEEYKFSDLEYENYAKSATKTEDLPKKQTDGVVPTGKKGHVLVNINVGGKDLVDFVGKGDDVAKQAFIDKEPLVEAAWKEVFEFFNDKEKFPDGATIIINNVINPMDDCVDTHSPHFFLLIAFPGLSEVKTGLLTKFNKKLRDMSNEKGNRYYADHHAAFLGHAHLYDNKSCPHYKSGAEYWMEEQKPDINIKGEAAYGQTLKELAKTMYKDCE